MKPNFALILSHDGIRLLLRANGGWRSMGEVSPEDPNLGEQLRFLRRTATELSGGKFATKLVIPNSQILYTKIDALGATDERRTKVIRKALDGATPYALDDLVFDWCDARAGMAHVAAVARETLDEAEAFASEHRLNPISFVAIPEDGTLDSEPYFGPTSFSETLLSDGETVEPDREIIHIIPQSEFSDAPVAGEAIDVPEVIEPEITDASKELASEIATGDLPDASDDIDDLIPESDPVEPLAEATFASRRKAEVDGSDDEPLRLKWVAPRIATDTQDQTKLGGASRATEFTSMAVTAPAVVGGSVPRAPTDTELGSEPYLPNSNKSLPDEVRLKPSSDTFARPDTAQPENEAEALTIFGARTKAVIGGKPKYLGMSLTLGLVAVIGLVAIVSGFFVESPLTSSRFWRSLTDPETVASEGQTATAVVASATFIEETPLPERFTPVAGIEMASLSPPDVPSDDLLRPTIEETAEHGTNTNPPEMLTPENAETVYAASGIWQLAPLPPVDPEIDRINNLYVASIDRVVVSNDAVALPSYSILLPDLAPGAFSSPPPAGTKFDLDERGFVRAVPEGAITQDGVRVIAGKPPKVPNPRPFSAPVAEAAVVPTEVSPLAANRPTLRPANLLTRNEKARLGGLTLAEIAKIRPTLRPASPQDGDQATAATANATATTAALANSRSPVVRPRNFSSAVERALAEAVASAPDENVVQASAAAVAPSAPSIPTKASVAKEATVKNAISLSQINLIGVYGSPSDRRALIRLKSGRYVKVQIGDKLDGGQVAAISASELKYIKGGKNVTLKMPTG